MPTKLTKPVSRETEKIFNRRPVIVTIAPAGNSAEALVGFRLKGTRSEYIARVSDLYRICAMWTAQKVSAAKKEARRNGEPWAKAKKRFDAANRI